MADRSDLYVGLKVSDWIFLLLLLLTVVVLAFWAVPRLLGVVVETIDAVALVVGTGSLTVAAFAALSTFRLKQEEQEEGRAGAQAVVDSDVSELFRTRNELQEVLDEESIEKDRWQKLVRRLDTLGKHFERRLDQLPFLSRHFSRSEFGALSDLYFRLRELTLHTDELKIPRGGSTKDWESSISWRRKLLRERLEEFAALARSEDVKQLRSTQEPEGID